MKRFSWLSYILGIFLSLMLQGQSAQASVTYGETLSEGNIPDLPFSDISDLSFSDGQLLITTKKELYTWVPTTHTLKQKLELTGKQKLFEASGISAVAALPLGRSLVVNSADHRWAILSESGDPLVAIAHKGDQEGELNDPVDVAYSSQGRVYIVEAENQRVSVFSPGGVFLFSLGDRSASKDVNLKSPQQVAVDQWEQIYVLDDYQGGRISIYSPRGELLKQLAAIDLQSFFPRKPRLQAMDVTLDGQLILADKNSGYIVLLNWNKMKIIDSFGSSGKGRGQFQNVRSMLFDEKSKKLFIADTGNKKIEVLQSDYQYQAAMNQVDLMAVQKSSVLKTVCSISYIYTDGRLLCLDKKEDKVSFLNLQGELIRDLSGGFSEPQRAVFDAMNLYILDKESVKVFDHEGNFQFSMGTRGSRSGQFFKPQGVALGEKIYVADTGNRRVQVFSRSGVFLNELGTNKSDGTTLKEPVAVAVDARNRVYVADQGLGQVLVYDEQGELVDLLGEADSKNVDFLKGMDDIAVDQHGILYVLGSTKKNDKLIRIYRNGYLLFYFSPLHIEAQVGMDNNWLGKLIPQKNGSASVDAVAGAAQGAVNLMTGLVTNAFGILESSFFSSKDEPWLFNQVLSNDALIAAVDPNKKARHTFLILRVPEAVSEFHVGGNERHVHLHWKKPTEDFMGWYEISRLDQKGEPVVLKAEVAETEVTLPRVGATQYRIVAISAYGKRSKPSSWFEDYFQSGLNFYADRQWPSAEHAFQQALNDNPTHQGAMEYLGRTLIAQGKLEEGATIFERLSQFPELRARAYNLQADALIKNKAWLEAKLILDKAVEMQVANAESYGLCAEALQWLDDRLGEINCLEKAIYLEPKQSHWQVQLSNSYQLIGAQPQAKAALDKAEVLSQSSEDRLQVGQAFEKIGEVERAIRNYQGVIRLDSSNQEAHILLAGAHISRGDLEGARRAAINMASIPALGGMANYVLGRVALSEHKVERALVLLNKAVESDPQRIEVWVALADAYRMSQDTLHEKRALKQALVLLPQQLPLYLQLAEACQREGNTLGRIETYGDALKFYPHERLLHLGLAHALIDAKNPVDAESELQIILASKANDVDALSALAEAQSMQGRISESIDTLQHALRENETRPDLYLQLARAYMGNHMYDQAEKMAEKAATIAPALGAPYALLGEIYLARQMFDEAIRSLIHATELAVDDPKYRQLLNLAYLQKKKVEAMGGDAVGPKLVKFSFEPAFAAAYKQYATTPLGHVTLKNDSGIDFQNIKVSFQIKEYMDFPSTHVIESLPAGVSLHVELHASLNNKILQIDEDTGLQTEVSVEYFLRGSPHVEKLNQPITVYGRNAIVWSDPRMIGGFVTPKDQALNLFVRQVVNQYKPQKSLLNEQISKAMTVFDVFHAMGMRYLIDPNNPYSKLSRTQIDTVQYPRETLRVNSGDCDDLSVLMSASLENLGIETAILDVPGHLLMMFNTELPESQRELISTQDDLVAIVEGKVWIPVEATLVGASFSEAWVEGARKYQRYSKEGVINRLYLHQVWESVSPVTLPPADYQVALPDATSVKALVDKEDQILVLKALERLVEPYRNLLLFDPHNAQAHMQIGIIYAKNGLYSDAIAMFESIVAESPKDISALNNLGNTLYLKKEYGKAISYYKKAFDLVPDHANILVNIAMSYYQQGDVKNATRLFQQAVGMDATVANRFKELSALLAS